MSEISRKASIREAKQLADATQEDYVRAEQKARTGEELVRKIHQKEVNRAMDVSLIAALPTECPPPHTHTEGEGRESGGDEVKATALCL